ncbi:LacI family DNA-binding transcriptional regulator [Pontibacillus litoralis]|uniref:LacI family transcription regulator n=1 Tax=Pontibacillus litoralis JSM 072002 TaxID=1385512 RepID=A0A0A5FZC3_9BACI|nr:LacI family DNA-binding transcriptional regulator [Pontibacillus litoralis]KGX86191.1 LacI family transcription regulator [Pontibacillus litoralis JSM 072002]
MTNIKDVARYANVSVTTVSRVLNGHPYVKAEKRNAVMEAVQALNYHQNSNAINLSKGRTMLLGVVVPFINHPYFSQLLHGISIKALEEGYTLVLFQTSYDRDKELEALEMLKHKQIDGVIITSRALPYEQVRSYTAYGAIVLCEDSEGGEMSTVSIDHYESFLAGMNYLIEKGHRRIGYCIARPSSPNSMLRLEAYETALQSINEPINANWAFVQCLTMEDGERVVHQYKHLRQKPSAFLVASDQVAAGIWMECKKQGIRVPQDLAILGLDNHPIARALGLSTIDLPIDQVGRELVVRAIDTSSIQKKKYGFTIVERGSV